MATLKISDLSVGDWVGYNGKSYRTVIVDALDQTATIFGNDEQGDIHIEQLAPIPITAEILEKNGFEEDNNGHYALKIGGIIAVDIEYTGGIWELSILDVYALQYAGKMQVTIAFVSSIHSLQHALRLAGVDKEINL